MSLSQWTEYKSDAAMQSVIRSVAPILGSGSLWTRRNGAGGSDRSIARVPGASLDRAYTKGRLRHLFRITAHSGSSFSWLGMGCMMSQEDLTAGAGSAYGLVLQSGDTSGTITSMVLVKFTAGYAQPGAVGTTILGTESGLSLALGTTVSMELRFNLDTAQFGGIVFEAYRGSATDFSDLALKLSVQSTTAVLTSTVNEWVGMYAHSTGNIEGYIDQTRHTRRA